MPKTFEAVVVMREQVPREDHCSEYAVTLRAVVDRETYIATLPSTVTVIIPDPPEADLFDRLNVGDTIQLENWIGFTIAPGAYEIVCKRGEFVGLWTPNGHLVAGDREMINAHFTLVRAAEADWGRRRR